ncbi:MAG: EF-Tu/IF-2/RF-3 family GTPase, partial [Desulfobacterales bacterium]
EERLLGRAEVRQTFHVPKVGTIAGCYVTDGRIERNQNIRVLRDGVVIYDGKIASLKRYKDDVKEAAAGYECGINIEKFNDIKVGDVLECYYMEEIKPELK